VLLLASNLTQSLARTRLAPTGSRRGTGNVRDLVVRSTCMVEGEPDHLLVLHGLALP
jgi:hypothetical protein